MKNIGWIVVKPGTWTLDNKTIIAENVGSFTDSYKSVTFSKTFSTAPVILSQVQSYNETDRGSHTRMKNPTSTGFDVKIEEETDTSHTYETVGYIAIEPSVLRSGSAKVGKTKYYPYGVTQEGGNEKYLYTGKELDKRTGLYYYEARYYNPKTGRFVQPDTIIPNVYNPQSLNRYSYVLNNPLRYRDPSGHSAGGVDVYLTMKFVIIMGGLVIAFAITLKQVGETAIGGSKLIYTMSIDKKASCEDKLAAKDELKDFVGGKLEETIMAFITEDKISAYGQEIFSDNFDESTINNKINQLYDKIINYFPEGIVCSSSIDYYLGPFQVATNPVNNNNYEPPETLSEALYDSDFKWPSPPGTSERNEKDKDSPPSPPSSWYDPGDTN